MTEINYLAIGATLNSYSTAAFSYIDTQKDFINSAADKLNLPINNAIAGAMVEERSGLNTAEADATDYIAQHYIPYQDLVGFVSTHYVIGQGMQWGRLFDSLQAGNYRLRLNVEWTESYEAYKTSNIDITNYNDYEKILIKLNNPVFVDLGLGNFNMATAIRLIEETPSNVLNTLELSGYKNSYAQIAKDLIDVNSSLTAKLYGLLIKEADTWFTSKNAYGSDWATLPQEIKDALYITYTNFGHDKMEQRYIEATNNGNIPFYDPLPAVGTGGGLNHLYNATDIAAKIGATGYGIDKDSNFIYDTSTWLQKAKLDNAEGAAYREALVKLRPFVVIDGSYDGGAAIRDNFTDEYLQDRTDMLAWKIQLRHSGVNPVGNHLYVESTNLMFFEDKATQQTIVLGNLVGAKRFIFGGSADESINGGDKVDHLYGGAGNDIISGGGGNDYLEGSQGNDTYIYTSGDGFDAFADSKAA